VTSREIEADHSGTPKNSLIGPPSSQAVSEFPSDPQVYRKHRHMVGESVGVMKSPMKNNLMEEREEGGE
jgi:hypothetical protein